AEVAELGARGDVAEVEQQRGEQGDRGDDAAGDPDPPADVVQRRGTGGLLRHAASARALRQVIARGAGCIRARSVGRPVAVPDGVVPRDVLRVAPLGDGRDELLARCFRSFRAGEYARVEGQRPGAVRARRCLADENLALAVVGEHTGVEQAGLEVELLALTVVHRVEVDRADGERGYLEDDLTGDHVRGTAPVDHYAAGVEVRVPESADGETREFDLPAGFLGVTAVLGGVLVLGLRLGERLGLEFLAAALVAAALLSGRRRARIRRSGGPAARGEYQHHYAGAHGRVCGSDHAGLLALATPLFDLPQCPPRDRRRQWSAYTASN